VTSDFAITPLFLFLLFFTIIGINMKKLLILIFAVILVAGCTNGNFQQMDPHTAKFAGVTLHFRADLYEADKVEVYPDEQTLRDVLLNPNIKTVWLAYIPNESENSFYLAASYELAYKLTIIYKGYWETTKPIDSIYVNSIEEITALETDPFILLLGPSSSNETKIEIDGYLIKCYGKDFSEIDRTYTDLDLCVDKLLLVLMKT